MTTLKELAERLAKPSADAKVELILQPEISFGYWSAPAPNFQNISKEELARLRLKTLTVEKPQRDRPQVMHSVSEGIHPVLSSHYKRKVMVNVAELDVPQHKKKRWMTEHYHQRIQKKWNKRYGKNAKIKGAVRAMLMSESVYNKIKAFADSMSLSNSKRSEV